MGKKLKTYFAPAERASKQELSAEIDLVNTARSWKDYFILLVDCLLS